MSLQCEKKGAHSRACNGCAGRVLGASAAVHVRYTARLVEAACRSCLTTAARLRHPCNRCLGSHPGSTGTGCKALAAPATVSRFNHFTAAGSAPAAATGALRGLFNRRAAALGRRSGGHTAICQPGYRPVGRRPAPAQAVCGAALQRPSAGSSVTASGRAANSATVSCAPWHGFVSGWQRVCSF